MNDPEFDLPDETERDLFQSELPDEIEKDEGHKWIKLMRATNPWLVKTVGR